MRTIHTFLKSFMSEVRSHSLKDLPQPLRAVLGEMELDTTSSKGTRLLTWQLLSDLVCHLRILGMSTRSPCLRQTQDTLPRAAGQQVH